MKKILIAGVAIILVFAGIAFSAEPDDDPLNGDVPVTTSAEIANRPWNAANIDALRTLDKAAVVRFTDMVGEESEGLVPVEDCGRFTWVDLAGAGKYQLLVNKYTKCCSYLYLYWRDAPGKVRVQRYVGAGEDFHQMVRDLDGDGKQELILYGKVDTDDRTPSLPAPVAEWPQVYRLRNGRYVEASRDFPSFYDSEVLPELEKEISDVRQAVAAQQGRPKPAPGPHANQQMVDNEWFAAGRFLAARVMERDKILRTLGRDPDAGLAEAREWMKSADSELLEDAAVVLADIGGHEQDLRAARSAQLRVQDMEYVTGN
ncbi:MAG TPA: hypothetical protein VN754_05505 [Candidatus Binataceae bacterium]|nr:hypothetical protein [Candidatus Binataceae bacterium]